MEDIPGSLRVAHSGDQSGTRAAFVVPAGASLVLVVEDAAQAEKAVDALRVVAYDQVSGYSTLQKWKAAGRSTASIDRILPQTLFERLSRNDSLHVPDVREPNEWDEVHIEGGANRMSWLFTKPQIKEVDPMEARKRHDAGSALLVDVREPHELREGFIVGAKHISLGTLQAHANELLAEPEIIFVCRSGQRSAAATAAFARAGHPSVYNMAGGMIAWKHLKLPVEQ